MDKSSFTGSPTLDERFGFKPDTRVDIGAEPDPDEPPEDPDIWNSRSREIRTSRHQVFAVLLVRKDKTLLMIPYSAIDSGEGRFNGDKFSFRFFRGEAPYEATIEGTLDRLQKVVDFLAGGKAEKIHAKGDEIREVMWEAVEEPEE